MLYGRDYLISSRIKDNYICAAVGTGNTLHIPSSVRTSSFIMSFRDTLQLEMLV